MGASRRCGFVRMSRWGRGASCAAAGATAAFAAGARPFRALWLGALGSYWETQKTPERSNVASIRAMTFNDAPCSNAHTVWAYAWLAEATQHLSGGRHLSAMCDMHWNCELLMPGTRMHAACAHGWPPRSPRARRGLLEARQTGIPGPQDIRHSVASCLSTSSDRTQSARS
jgi:hypothetical protein